ncbi:MAG: DNA repair protein RadC [Holophagales bacterium]|nr:DNA repair protein RadC [Holophagales bacterium]
MQRHAHGADRGFGAAAVPGGPTPGHGIEHHGEAELHLGETSTGTETDAGLESGTAPVLASDPSGQSLSKVPHNLRPRERLVTAGGHGLSDAELLAVLLRTGRPGQSALDMAEELLDEHGGLGGLMWTDARRLCRYGLRTAKAGTVMAAVELARRLARTRMSDEDVLDRPGAVANYLLLRFGRIDQEVVGALFLDSENRLLGEAEVFRGTLTRAAVEPRAVLREALLYGASGLILFHTHPSGDPAPSGEDLDFTRRLAEACGVVGMELIDHLVVGGFGRWVSLKQRGAW